MPFFESQAQRLAELKAEAEKGRQAADERADANEWMKLKRAVADLFPSLVDDEEHSYERDWQYGIDSMGRVLHKARVLLFEHEHIAFYYDDGLKAMLVCGSCCLALTHGITAEGTPATVASNFHFGYRASQPAAIAAQEMNNATTVVLMQRRFEEARGLCNPCRALDDERQAGEGVFMFTAYRQQKGYLLVHGKDRTQALSLYLDVYNEWLAGRAVELPKLFTHDDNPADRVVVLQDPSSLTITRVHNLVEVGGTVIVKVDDVLLQDPNDLPFD